MAPSNPAVKVSLVEQEDLVVIAEIMMAAFGAAGDVVHENIFPPERRPSRAQRIIDSARRMEAQLKSGKSVTVKAALESTGETVGYAQWVEPKNSETEDSNEDKRKRFEAAEKDGIDMDFLVRFYTEILIKRKQIMGDEPHWYLMVLAVAPSHQKKGIGKALVEWGTAQADNADPPVDTFLESSAAGWHLYEKLGFQVVDWCEVKLASGGSMRLPSMRRKAVSTPSLGSSDCM